MIKLELTLEEVNTILFLLSERPYKEVFLLITKIQEQGNKQVKQETEEGSKYPFPIQLLNEDKLP